MEFLVWKDNGSYIVIVEAVRFESETEKMAWFRRMMGTVNLFEIVGSSACFYSTVCLRSVPIINQFINNT